MENMETEKNPSDEENNDNEENRQMAVESEDSSSDDDQEDTANKVEVERLQAVLAENPYDYASHLALIALLQKMGELESLRQARQNMSEKYPLSAEIWLAWIKDEINIATTQEQKEQVVQLCERAVEDYLSVDVWLEYLQFSIGNMGTESNAAESVRQLFERALTAAGLHFTKGAIIWESFREFESILIHTVDPMNESDRKKQVDRVAILFRRQLACPLLNMQRTLEEFESWRKEEGATSSIDDSMVKLGYERALTQLNARLPYEDRVISVQNDSELLDSYNAYLKFEKQNGDPGRITVLYERAIAALSLESSVWLSYINYVEQVLKTKEIVEKLLQRASRNVPWCVQVWQNWMRFYERSEKPLVQVQQLMESALAAGFQGVDEYRTIWILYLEYLRRRLDKGSEKEEEKNLEILRNNFNRACDHLARHFGMDGDPDCVILQFWARTEAIHARDMEKTRSLWTDILSQDHSNTAASWMEYITLERCYGDTKHLRKLFQKALSSVKDWPEKIANSWLDFERDEGSLEQLEYCEAKIKERLDKVAEERGKSQVTQETFSSSANSLQQVKKATKRKAVETAAKWKHLEVSPKKVPKVERSKLAPPPGYTDKEDEAMDQEEEHFQEVDTKSTVFISNLDYTATEEDVREALKPAGPVTLFRMVKDFKGRSKGFCYVQLTDEFAVEEALKLDRTLVGGRPMFVSRCKPDKGSREGGFRYKCVLEKNKLFVKGLALTTTKEQLEQLFQEYGALKEVRLVTYRNGHSKGIAYVEFKDEAHAKKALLTTDGMKVDGKIISVAISKPPERKNVDDNAPLIKSLGGSDSSRNTFGVPKTVLSMVPRNVRMPAAKIEPSGDGVKKPMSNADFRNVLLGKK